MTVILGDLEQRGKAPHTVVTFQYINYIVVGTDVDDFDLPTWYSRGNIPDHIPRKGLRYDRSYDDGYLVHQLIESNGNVLVEAW
jgi:hypothetical protein